MSITWKGTNGIIVVGVVVAGIVAGLTPESFMLTFTNIIFYIGLVLGIIGGLFMVGETGFFKVPAYPFSKLKFIMFGNKTSEEEKEMTFKNYMDEPLSKYPLTRPVIYGGIALLILSYVLSIIIMTGSLK